MWIAATRTAKCPSCGGRFLLRLNENEIKPWHARDSDELSGTSEAQVSTKLSEGQIDPRPIDSQIIPRVAADAETASHGTKSFSIEATLLALLLASFQDAHVRDASFRWCRCRSTTGYRLPSLSGYRFPEGYHSNAHL